MFALKSTLAAVKAQRDFYLDAYDRLFGEAHEEREEAARTIAALRAELATTYVRDAKGRMARHPSAAVQSLDKLRSGDLGLSGARRDRDGRVGG
jgi:hypothetical protein